VVLAAGSKTEAVGGTAEPALEIRRQRPVDIFSKALAAPNFRVAL